ncbi:uncharacterized protein TNCV_4778351 [Trichonephila clavipes]|nr:uncharacterized protein TNCV_4778351 [Trichonephila clavipes]
MNRGKKLSDGKSISGKNRLTDKFIDTITTYYGNAIRQNNSSVSDMRQGHMDFLCLDSEHIFGGDQADTPEIIDEILTTARDLELEESENDKGELIKGHEDELPIEELHEILNEEHQETQRNMSPEQEEDERGPLSTSAIKDLEKWEDVRAMVLEWHPNQADVSRVGNIYNDSAINYFRKILKKREKQSTLDMFFNAP